MLPVCTYGYEGSRRSQKRMADSLVPSFQTVVNNSMWVLSIKNMGLLEEKQVLFPTLPPAQPGTLLFQVLCLISPISAMATVCIRLMITLKNSIHSWKNGIGKPQRISIGLTNLSEHLPSKLYSQGKLYVLPLAILVNNMKSAAKN